MTPPSNIRKMHSTTNKEDEVDGLADGVRGSCGTGNTGVAGGNWKCWWPIFVVAIQVTTRELGREFGGRHKAEPCTRGSHAGRRSRVAAGVRCPTKSTRHPSRAGSCNSVL